MPIPSETLKKLGNMGRVEQMIGELKRLEDMRVEVAKRGADVTSDLEAIDQQIGFVEDRLKASAVEVRDGLNELVMPPAPTAPVEPEDG